MGMPTVNEAVVAGALVAAVVNAIPALLGGWRWYRGESSRAFWVFLRIAQGAAVLFALAVGVLAAASHTSSENLFYLYALLPLAVAFIAEQLRVASAQTVLDQRGLESAQRSVVSPRMSSAPWYPRFCAASRESWPSPRSSSCSYCCAPRKPRTGSERRELSRFGLTTCRKCSVPIVRRQPHRSQHRTSNARSRRGPKR